MPKMMVGDATVRAITGDIVLARGSGGTDDGREVGRGTAVIAIGETVIEMDGAREIRNGALAETDIMTDEVWLFFPFFFSSFIFYFFIFIFFPSPFSLCFVF